MTTDLQTLTQAITDAVTREDTDYLAGLVPKLYTEERSDHGTSVTYHALYAHQVLSALGRALVDYGSENIFNDLAVKCPDHDIANLPAGTMKSILDYAEEKDAGLLASAIRRMGGRQSRRCGLMLMPPQPSCVKIFQEAVKEGDPLVALNDIASGTLPSVDDQAALVESALRTGISRDDQKLCDRVLELFGMAAGPDSLESRKQQAVSEERYEIAGLIYAHQMKCTARPA